jgi:arylsulfatase
LGIIPADQDRWQLFNVKDDPTESTDLAQKYPKKLQEMKDLCQKEAEKYGDLLMEETQFSRGFADAFLD